METDEGWVKRSNAMGCGSNGSNRRDLGGRWTTRKRRLPWRCRAVDQLIEQQHRRTKINQSKTEPGFPASQTQTVRLVQVRSLTISHNSFIRKNERLNVKHPIGKHHAMRLNTRCSTLIAPTVQSCRFLTKHLRIEVIALSLEYDM